MKKEWLVIINFKKGEGNDRPSETSIKIDEYHTFTMSQEMIKNEDIKSMNCNRK